MLHERTCKRCGNEFTTTNGRKVHCRPDCSRAYTNGSRAARRLSNDITFVGVDGEGVDRPDGTHEYVMLSVGSETLWRDGRALTLREILSFLWERYTEKPDAAYVGFYLGYDFIQWEKLLMEREARLLLTNDGIVSRKSRRQSRANPYPDAVVVDEGRWEIDIMAGRRFKLRPHVHHRSDYGPRCRNRTCEFPMEGSVDASTVRAGEPTVIHPREMDWRVPTGNGPGTVWRGSAKGFWKRFMPRVHSVSGGGNAARIPGWLYICDTGPFWQTSFLKAIDPKGWPSGHAVCTEEEYETVVRGKADRGRTYDYDDSSYAEEMQKYNVLENAILGRITARLNEGFMNETIPIKIPKADWYGPGRAAQLWMDMLHERVADKTAREYNKTIRSKDVPSSERHNEQGLLNADVYMSMPSWAYNAARASYYGGWFEQMVHGHCGDVWEYDINSAYPFIIASLPCLHTTGVHNGVYSQGNGDAPSNDGRYTLVFGTVRGSDDFVGAMPHRTRHGSILRPHVTKGWYWLHEIEAATRAGLIDSVDVEEWVSYLPCECSPPFDPDDIGISRMYRMRLDVGKNSPQGKSAKLVYNSAYGKTAQSIGSPKYSNPFYASLITAGCRALILDSIATHPGKSGAVTMVATDGVYFTERHPTLELSDTRLGAWDETFKPGMTQLMPGVYWDDSTREAIGMGRSPKMKSRGVNANDLAKEIATLDQRFANQHARLNGGLVYEWPEIRFEIRFLMDSAKLALQRGKWETAGRVQHGSVRTISSNPVSKRVPDAYRDDATGLTRTRPYAMGPDGADTHPYKKSFGYIDEAELTVDRDGSDALAYFRNLLKP